MTERVLSLNVNMKGKTLGVVQRYKINVIQIVNSVLIARGNGDSGIVDDYRSIIKFSFIFPDVGV